MACPPRVLVASALEYAAAGYRVVPVRPGAKVPLVRNWPKAASAAPAVIRDWWTKWPRANLALLTEGVVVVDIDGAPPPEWLTGRKHQSLKAARAPLQRTPRAGWHLFLKLPPGKAWKSSTKLIAPNVDIKTGGGSFVVVSPSQTAAGRYQWLRPLVPKDELPLPPEWLIDELDRLHRPPAPQVIYRTYGPPPPERLARIMEGPPIFEGVRNSTLTRIAGSLRARGLEADEIAGLLLEVNARRCTPPLAEREVAAIAKSIGRYPAGCPVVVGQEVFKRAWRRAAKRRSSWRALTLK